MVMLWKYKSCNNCRHDFLFGWDDDWINKTVTFWHSSFKKSKNLLIKVFRLLLQKIVKIKINQVWGYLQFLAKDNYPGIKLYEYYKTILV